MTRPAAEVEADVEAQRARLDQTAHALKDKITPGEVFEEASQAMGEAGQQVLARFLEQARQNPMPVALVGVGLVWLMRSSGRNGGADHDVGRRGLGAGMGRLKEGAEHLGEKAQGLGQDLARRAHEAGDSMSRSTHELQDQAADMVSQAKEKASDMKGQIGDTLAHARETGQAAAERVGSGAQNASRLAQDSGRWLSQIVEEIVDGEPLILGAVGLAVGFAIGSALPRTHVEDQTLGPAHDKLVEKGREAAQEVIQEAGNVAQAAYAAVREELKPSGEAERGESPSSKPETV
jgi:hypothetical protein